MLPELREWARTGSGGPAAVLVSTGSVQSNREMDLDVPILLDEGFRLAAAFCAGGTPSAIRVDAQGRIASALAVGAPACMSLARA